MRHKGISPARQYSQVRSLEPGLKSTRSPTFRFRTAEPMLSTIPAPSEPTTHPGVIFTPGTPSTTKRSRWLSAPACIRTRTSVSLVSWGSGASSV